MDESQKKLVADALSALSSGTPQRPQAPPPMTPDSLQFAQAPIEGLPMQPLRPAPGVARLYPQPQPRDPRLFRRTFVPILLTLGTILIVAGLAVAFAGETSVWPEIFSRREAIAAVAIGVLSTGLGVLSAATLKKGT